jgi:hypothetical protein
MRTAFARICASSRSALFLLCAALAVGEPLQQRAVAEEPFVAPAESVMPASASTDTVATAEQHPSIFSSLSGKVDLGLRFTHFTLDNPEKGTWNQNHDEFEGGFLGSINRLEEKQEKMPFPFVRFFPCRYAGIELGYDHMAAVTRKWTSPNDSLDTDGTFNLQGPETGLILRWPNRSLFTPFVGLGVIWYLADFENEEWWHNGFGSYSDPEYLDWTAQGRPERPNNGYQRTITTSDVTASFETIGVLATLGKGWGFDFEWRWMQADAEAHYKLLADESVIEDRGLYKFPFSNTAWQASLVYAF